ncbi:MAG: hypothetical protein GXP26_11470 [Planctomycetes bacterium]|nr:hypothetical protein [Planctomycetota bacterium]
MPFKQMMYHATCGVGLCVRLLNQPFHAGFFLIESLSAQQAFEIRPIGVRFRTRQGPLQGLIAYSRQLLASKKS